MIACARASAAVLLGFAGLAGFALLRPSLAVRRSAFVPMAAVAGVRTQQPTPATQPVPPPPPPPLKIETAPAAPVWTPRRTLPDAGDLASPGALARALSIRATDDHEIIFIIVAEHKVRLVLNLILNLDQLRLHHHLVVAPSSAACSELSARAQRLNLSVGCGQSSFLRRGVSSQIDAGLAAYDIGDSHVYHTWWQRWFLLSEAVGQGYRALSLEVDVSLRADPYPLLRGALGHHSLVTGLDDDQITAPYHFPPASVDFVYARGPAGGGAHWVLCECRRRLEQLLRGEVIPLPSRRGQTQPVVWDSPILKDTLETAAFTPAAPSYRHAQLHCMERDGGGLAGKRAPPLPGGWALRTEQLRFFARAVAVMPSAWLPLFVPRQGWHHEATKALPRHQQLSCNASARDGIGTRTGLWDSWGGPAEPRIGDAIRSGSFAAVPMWLFSAYQVCPHGGACGRWGWQPPPVVIGSLVGVKARFWMTRVLGWWHYEASRQPPPASAVVFPRSSVRPLVLRGHALHLGPKHSSEFRKLRAHLLRWTLLALALGRRAVLPMVPCTIPTPEMPPEMVGDALLVKLMGSSSCDARTRRASWRLAAAIPPEASHEQLRITPEMSAIGNYSAVADIADYDGTRRNAGCCALLPVRSCVDQVGERGELRDELLLNERDLGWLVAEEAAMEAEGTATRSTSLVRPVRQLSLEALHAHDEARTLVIELPGSSSLRSPWLDKVDEVHVRRKLDDPLALLPRTPDVRAAVRTRLKDRKGGLHGARKCVERLLHEARRAGA